MKGIHYAVLTAQTLSYCLIITFIFADALYHLTGALTGAGTPPSLQSAYTAACLVGLVGAINTWLTWYYISKSNTVRDMLVICAWTHRVKTKEGWMSLEDFFSKQLGYAVSHGLSEEKLNEMRSEVDRDWRRVRTPGISPSEGKPELGMSPREPEPRERRHAPLSPVSKLATQGPESL